MKHPAWVQELRDLLGIEPYGARASALQQWARRWVVEVAAEVCVPEEGREKVWHHLEERLRAEVGYRLAEVMAAIEVKGPPGWDTRGMSVPVVQVQAIAVAIRREPRP